MTYSPSEFRQLTFHDAVPRFADGSDTPRAYLERCLEVIAAREPVVQALVAMNEAGAREAADASTARYKAGRPLSPVDGMPIGIKDLIETKDMPTQMGCEAYAGNFPKRDSALVQALRDAGAVVLAKTVTAELGGAHPGPTTNPFNPRHTPGGSSSGSAAAVAAREMPATIGGQVGGSIIRPASYCGNIALKPTQGAINRGERLGTSQSTNGVHAGSIEDMWSVAIAIASRVGGDPGFPGLFGPERPPMAARPARLIAIETEGWASADGAVKAVFEQVLAQLRAMDVTILRRADHPWIEAFERSIADARAICNGCTNFESRWSLRNLIANYPDKVSARTKARVAGVEKLTVEDYRAALARRDEARRAHALLAPLADAMITLSAPGPAPVWEGDKPGQPLAARPTGDFVFNAASSMLGAPAVQMPLAAMGGLPVGVQLIGQPHTDARMTALAAWVLAKVKPVVA